MIMLLWREYEVCSSSAITLTLARAYLIQTARRLLVVDERRGRA